MRLNKYQKAWIKRLMSGRSRKYKGLLFGSYSESNCCLGVAARVCVNMNLCKMEEKISHPNNLDDVNLKIKQTLKINRYGKINEKLIKPKWIKFFKDRNIDYFGNLINLNDDTNMSHREIGRFINENREAIFGQG
jgi:hypothetical protein